MNETKKGKVLIVDDSETVLAAASQALGRAGYEVITADKALMTSRTISREKPDLVLLDVNMPTLTGDKLAEIVLGRLAPENRPVLLLHSDVETRELEALAKKCGADGFVRKSSELNLLVMQVHIWMARRNARRNRSQRP